MGRNINVMLIYREMTVFGMPIFIVGNNMNELVEITAHLPLNAKKESNKFLEEMESLINEYLLGKRKKFNLELNISSLTLFSQKVLRATLLIPYGRTLTYGEIAKKIGFPKAARAVGQALKHNPFPFFIPCHRVVSRNSLGGFALGISNKENLLKLEMKTLSLVIIKD